MLPGISDAEDQIAEVTKAAADAGARSVTPMLLFLSLPVKRHWMRRLRTHHPELVSEYAHMDRNRSRIQP